MNKLLLNTDLQFKDASSCERIFWSKNRQRSPNCWYLESSTGHTSASKYDNFLDVHPWPPARLSELKSTIRAEVDDIQTDNRHSELKSSIRDYQS